MTPTSLLDEIRETNLSYLLLAQRMIRENKAEATYRLGLSVELADVLASLSTAQLLKIASSSTLVCRFRFDDQMIWDLITDHQRDGGLANIHAAIVACAQPLETIS